MKTKDRERNLHNLALEFEKIPGMGLISANLLKCKKDRESNNRYAYRCKSVCCYRCRSFNGPTWRSIAMEAFSKTKNEECFFVTILISKTSNLDLMQDIVKGFKMELRNLRDRNARLNPRWNIQVFGQVEIDCVPYETWGEIPDERRSALDEIPSYEISSDSTDIWIPHAHLGIICPGLYRSELQEVLSKQFPGKNRVDIKKFEKYEDADDNFRDIHSYSQKHLAKNKLKTKRDNGRIVWTSEKWSLKSQVKYWCFLAKLRRGFSPLRVRIRSMPLPKQKSTLESVDLASMTQSLASAIQKTKHLPILFRTA